MSRLFLFWVCVFLGVLYFPSCSNDFELTEEEGEIPVVYGTIDAGDTAIYVRVERAFIDKNISALILAKDISRLYFQDIDVSLQHVKSGKEFTLNRVDGNQEGYNRKSGAFADAPNYLYKIKQSAINLVPKDQYKLIIRNKEKNILSEANTTVITPLKNEDITNPGPTALLSFVNNLDFKLRWFGDENAVIHDVSFVFIIREEKNGTFSNKTLTWTVVSNTDKSEFTIKGRDFFEFINGSLAVEPTTKRFIQNTSLIITSGGKEIKDYISIGQANLGITSSGEIPTYSNLSNGGLGIFTSTTSFRRNNMGFTNITLDSLRNGSITKSLNFQ